MKKYILGGTVEMKENEAGVLKGKVNFKQLADKTGKTIANVAQGVGKGTVSIVDKEIVPKS